jgi:hypothetical protein
MNVMFECSDSNLFVCVLTVVRKQNTLVCQFASPLDVNMHDKPEVSHCTYRISLTLIEKPYRFVLISTSSCKQCNGASLDQIQITSPFGVFRAD